MRRHDALLRGSSYHIWVQDLLRASLRVEYFNGLPLSLWVLVGDLVHQFCVFAFFQRCQGPSALPGFRNALEIDHGTSDQRGVGHLFQPFKQCTVPAHGIVGDAYLPIANRN